MYLLIFISFFLNLSVSSSSFLKEIRTLTAAKEYQEDGEPFLLTKDEIPDIIGGAGKGYICSMYNAELCIGVSTGNGYAYSGDMLQLKNLTSNLLSMTDSKRLLTQNDSYLLLSSANMTISPLYATKLKYDVFLGRWKDRLQWSYSLSTDYLPEGSQPYIQGNIKLINSTQCLTILKCRGGGGVYCSKDTNEPVTLPSQIQKGSYLRLRPCSSANGTLLYAQMFGVLPPTNSPTLTPTTFQPTTTPTQLPTLSPQKQTGAPVVTSMPTNEPTNQPTLSPFKTTSQPTTTPSIQPTYHPITQQPTSEPSIQPTTTQPTFQLPTVAPTIFKINTGSPVKTLSPSSTQKATSSPTKSPTGLTNDQKLGLGLGLGLALLILLILIICIFWQHKKRTEKEKKEIDLKRKSQQVIFDQNVQPTIQDLAPDSPVPLPPKLIIPPLTPLSSEHEEEKQEKEDIKSHSSLGSASIKSEPVMTSNVTTKTKSTKFMVLDSKNEKEESLMQEIDDILNANDKKGEYHV